jgi:anaerobic dimethyl sulfoxide reductase subunit B (iron-sulfur subunit)
MPQLGWHVNIDNCIGCRACEAACKQEFDLPVGVRRRFVVIQEGVANNKPFRMHITSACNHCAVPACMNACPVKRYWKDVTNDPESVALRAAFGMDANPPTGLVLTKPSAAEDPVNGVDCIACKRCIAACPYGAVQFDEQNGHADKCVGCYHRLFNTNLPLERREPACVVTCSALTLHMDDLAFINAGQYGTANKLTGSPVAEIANPMYTDPSVRFTPQTNLG